MKSLKNKIVAITGGGRGIGLATARALMQEGALVAIGDIDAPLAKKAAKEFNGFGTALDVRDTASFARFLDETEATLGPIDVLINNAGIMPTGAFHEENDALTATQIAINLQGVITGCKLAVNRMLPRDKGHIVNIASMAGRLAIPGLSVYCATKFGVVGLTETLREEYRDTGIDFSMVLPAKVTTELASGTDEAARHIPSVPPEQVASDVVQAILKRRPEVPVPGYLSAASRLQGVAPGWALRGIRQAFGDHAILDNGLDETARASYNSRLDQLSGGQTNEH